MARTDSARLTDHGPLVPAMGTFPSSANTLYPKGTIVTLSDAGRAKSPTTADLSGDPALGVSKATFLNRTGDEMGGLDDSGFIEVDYGIHFFDISGTTPLTNQVVYVVDNQTVSLDPSTGRGVAGICTEVRTLNGVAQCGVFMGPTALASAGAMAEVVIPLNSFVDADGDPLAKFASAASPTFGLNLADSEALNIRWNNDAAPGTALCQVALPSNLDDARPAVLEFLVSKSGATVGDATTLTVTAFIVAPGDLHDADANAGGVTNALVGNATAKTTTLLSLTLAAADIPANARSMTFTVTPTAGLLGTDDLMLHDVRLRYFRK
jgi:hypothetical protein